MDLAAAGFVFSVEDFDMFYGEADHGLVANLAGEDGVGDNADVEFDIAAF